MNYCINPPNAPPSRTGVFADNEGLMREMSERALKIAKPNASVEIAKHVLSLVNSSIKL